MTRQDGTRWPAIIVLFLAGCTLALHAGKAPSALPLLRDEFGLGLTATGAIVSTWSVLIACTGLLAGLLVMRIGYVRFAVAGVALAGIGSALGLLSDGFPFLLLSRALEGFGWIVAVVALPSMLAALSDARDRPLVMGIWGAFVPLGAGVMLLIAPVLQASGGWRLSWGVAGLVSLAASLAVIAACRRNAERLATLVYAGQVLAERPFAALRQPAAWCLAGCFFAYSFQFMSVISFLPTLFVDTTELSLSTASRLTAVVMLSNVVGNVLAGVLLVRGVDRITLLIVSALLGSIAAALIFQPDLPIALRIAAAIAFSAIGGITPGTLFATAPLIARTPARVGVLIGLMLQGAGAGQLLGPLALPFSVERLGVWSAAVLPIGVAGLVGVLAAVLLAWFARQVARDV